MMMNSVARRVTRAEGRSLRLFALSGAYTVVMSALNVLPILVPALMSKFNLGAEEAGILLTLELFSIAAVPIVLARWAPRFSLKPLLCFGLIVTVVGNILSVLASDCATMMVVRVVAGMGAGVLLLGTNTAMAHADDPVKDYGFINTVGLVIAFLLCFIMPKANASYGLLGNYGLFIVLCFVASLFVLRLPAEGSCLVDQKVATHSEKIDVSKPKVVLLIVSLLLVQISYMAGYSFTESFGSRLGISTTQAGSLLAVAQIFAFAGTAAAARMGSRFGIRNPLLVSLAIQAMCLLGLTITTNPIIFVAMLFSCTFFYLFALSYQLGIGAELEHTGRLAALGGGVFYLGLSGGPLLGGYLLTAYGSASIGWSTAAANVLAILIYAFVAPPKFN